MTLSIYISDRQTWKQAYHRFNLREARNEKQ